MFGQLYMQYSRRNLARALHEIRHQFDAEVRGARSAKFAASTTAVAGSVLSIVGFGLSFFTFGASSVIGYVGTGIAGILYCNNKAPALVNICFQGRAQAPAPALPSASTFARTGT